VGLVVESGAILPIGTDEGTQGCHRAGDGIWGFGQVDVHTGAEGIRLGTWDLKNDMSCVIMGYILCHKSIWRPAPNFDGHTHFDTVLLSRLGLCPDTSSGELRSCSTLGAYPQDKFDLPTSL
jgi:hypothetical protein